MPQQTIDLTPFIVGLILLLGALVTFRLIPWIKARTTKEQYANLQAVARTLVYAAEQLYGANHGEEKLEYVLQKLEEKGFHADRDVIEAAVYEAFHWGELPRPISSPEEYDPTEAPEPAAPLEEPTEDGAARTQQEGETAPENAAEAPEEPEPAEPAPLEEPTEDGAAISQQEGENSPENAAPAPEEPATMEPPAPLEGQPATVIIADEAEAWSRERAETIANASEEAPDPGDTAP